jgi:hypothetical protein
MKRGFCDVFETVLVLLGKRRRARPFAAGPTLHIVNDYGVSRIQSL